MPRFYVLILTNKPKAASLSAQHIHCVFSLNNGLRGYLTILLAYGSAIRYPRFGFAGRAPADSRKRPPTRVVVLFVVYVTISYLMRSNERTRASSRAMPRIANTTKIIATNGINDAKPSVKFKSVIISAKTSHKR